MSGALALIDRATGEVVHADASSLLASAGIDDVRDAATNALAAFMHNVTTLRGIANEAQGMASDELVARLDRNGKWTLREGGYEIKSSSPEAGTVAYDTDLLREALAELVGEGVVSAQGANAALQRVDPPAPVSYALLHTIRLGLQGSLDFPEFDALMSEIETLVGDEPPPPGHSVSSG